MPSPKDLTGDLIRLRKTGALPSGSPPKLPKKARIRTMAFDPLLWIENLLIGGGLIGQAMLILWML